MCGAPLQGRVSSQQAAAMLEEPELQESDLLPQKYEGELSGRAGGGALQVVQQQHHWWHS
jgi:hypothetical protein